MIGEHSITYFLEKRHKMWPKGLILVCFLSTDNQSHVNQLIMAHRSQNLLVP